MSSVLEYTEDGKQVYKTWVNYKTKIFLNDKQKEDFEKISNTFRFCYNWALAICDNYYQNSRTIPTIEFLSSLFTQYKHEPEHKWLNDYNVAMCRSAFLNAITAFKKYDTLKQGYPKFKKKHKAEKKFKVDGNKLSFKTDHQIHIPGMGRRKVDYIECKNNRIPKRCNVSEFYHNVYISFDGDNYWLSMSILMTEVFNMEEAIEPCDCEPLGIDLGIRKAATLSNGTVFEGPSLLRVEILDNRIKKMDSAIHKDIEKRKEIAARTKTKYEDIPKSKNQLKREAKHRKALRDMHNLYNTYYHQMSSSISKMHAPFVVLEGFEGNHAQLRKNSHDAANKIKHGMMATARTYISYKCIENGTRVIYADRSFPSTQICNNCGYRQKIGKAKIYKCPICGNIVDRDLNAAYNLRDYGIKTVAQLGGLENIPLHIQIK